MHPELFHIGPIPIRSYGLMLALSFLAGLWYVRYVTRKDGRSFDPYLAVAYIMIVGGVVGARLAYVLFHLEEFAGNWTRTFNPFATDAYGIAGLNLYGGVILAVAGAWAYLRIKKISVLETFDYFAPTIGLGLGLTRIGCFLNGCCFGTPTDLPWGVAFPEGSIPYWVFGSQHLHPSQLYSSLYGILLFLFLHFVVRPRRRFAGQMIAAMFMIEAVFRYAIEYVRYYEGEMHLHLLGMEPTYNHLMSIGLFLLGLGIYLFAGRRRRDTAVEAN
jgi:phosphatidylglycerol:prolipoprotein diacylglycerol transferase